MSNESQKMKISIIFGILVGILLILTIVFAVLYGIEKNKTTKNENDEICLTPYCIKTANLLLESIDDSVEPCENFFEFTCGKWLTSHRIPEDAGSHDTINLLRTQLDNDIVDILSLPLSNKTKDIQAIINAQRFYNSCIDELAIENAGVEDILSLIKNEFGGWPILEGSAWNEILYNFPNLLFKLREYNQNTVYSCSTAIDDRNSSVYFIRIGQGDLGLEQRMNYVNETKLNLSYRQFMRDLVRLLTNDTSMVEKDVEEIYNFEKNLSKFHWTPAEQRLRQNETIRTTLTELPNVFHSNIDFVQYLRSLYSLSNITLNPNDTVSVNQLEFLHNATILLNQTSARTIQNYFLWRFMMNRVTNMPKRYRLVRELFDQYLYGTINQRPRTIVCGNFVNVNMGFAISKVYIERYFDEKAKTQSLEMIANIRNTFIQMLKDSTWMDENSKEKAIDKALAIDEQIGYPNYLGSDNNTELEIMYRDYMFNSSYMKNMFKLLQIKSEESFRSLREIVDRKAWGSSPPSIVNAFYGASKNQISFPAGILQMPFFNKDAPKYLNYGGIGVVIGHEITHGFDDSGRQYDKEGNRIPWWSDETITKFNERKQCIVDQYSNYTIAQIGLQLNGYQTQGENIADNGGLKEAFYAYKNVAKFDRSLPGLKHFSNEQLFFVWYGKFRCYREYNDYKSYLKRFYQKQSTGHAIDEFRVIGPTSNFDEFDRVFKCKPGQGNSRMNKCTVW